MSPRFPTICLSQVVSRVNFVKKENCPNSGKRDLPTGHSTVLRCFQENLRTSFLGTQQKQCSTRHGPSISSVFCRFRSTKAGRELRVSRSVNSCFSQPFKITTLNQYTKHKELISRMLFSSSFFHSVCTF